MATTHKKRRKVVLVKPPKKPKVQPHKALTPKQKSKLAKSHVLVSPIKVERLGGRRSVKRFYSAHYQLERKKLLDRTFKEKYLRGKVKLTKRQKEVLAYAKKYKSAVAKKYSQKLAAELKKKGYFKSEIKHALKYTAVGKFVEYEKQSKIYVEKWSKDLKRAKVNGKWLTEKQLNRKMAKVIKEGRIKGYMAVCGLKRKEAEEVFAWLQAERRDAIAERWRALIY